MPLNVIGGATPSVTFSTSNVSNDTIGGSIYVPIISSSRSFIGDLDFIVRYDTSVLVYAGAFQAGTQADATTSRSVGSAHIHFPRATSSMQGNIAGYAVFNFFPNDSSCTLVTLDSFAITQRSEICATASSPITSVVCGVFGCGNSPLSGFLRYHKIPTLTIVPNPSSTYASIHSDMDLGDVTIEIYDALGKLISRNTALLFTNQPALTSLRLS